MKFFIFKQVYCFRQRLNSFLGLMDGNQFPLKLNDKMDEIIIYNMSV